MKELQHELELRYNAIAKGEKPLSYRKISEKLFGNHSKQTSIRTAYLKYEEEADSRVHKHRIRRCAATKLIRLLDYLGNVVHTTRTPNSMAAYCVKHDITLED